MKNNYDLTVRVCFVTFVVQALVINFAPLLFVTFRREFGLPMSQVTALITLNFGIQLVTDISSVFFLHRLGYKKAMFLAHVFCAAGLLLLPVLPFALENSFAGLIVPTLLYGIGSGLIEVLVSPIVESCPTENSEAAMSLLHSFYSWGYAAVVLLSTAFFAVFGISRWRVLSVVWAAVPLVNMIFLARAPMPPVIRVEGGVSGIGRLFKTPAFLLAFVMMICAGGSEQAVCQWSSAFAESALGVSKTFGDLLGPTFFAVSMGVARTLFGKFGGRLDLGKCMLFSAALCTACYLTLSFSRLPVLSLAACGMTGFACGIFWPGTLSMAAGRVKNGGSAMFSLLALAGDIGCNAGPTFAGAVASARGEDLRAGLSAAAVLPVLMLVCVLILSARKNSIGNQAKML